MRNRMYRKNSPLILLMLFLLSSCNNQTVYHSYQHISDDGWSKSDTLFFNVPLTDSTVYAYKLSVEIRNKGNYPYTDLYLFLSHNTSDSTIFVTDTLKCTLADSEGKWQGTGLGSFYQTRIPGKDFPTLRKGNYVFKISQGMQDALLQGINDIGIHIEK